MSKFTIYPAIDLRNGMVVRLKYGDPQQKTTYGSEPAAFAKQWLDYGANWLHVIDLDAAFGDDDTANQKAIKHILAKYGNSIQIQTGGGIRSLDKIENMLKLGVTRVILGTVAVEKPQLVKEAIRKFGAKKIVVGIDARDGKVKTKGWKESSALSPAELASQLKEYGLQTVIYTDIARDGTGEGINLESTEALAQTSGLEVIASGGVNNIKNVDRVKSAGLPGVVIGKALYDGKINPAALFERQDGEKSLC